MQINILKNWLEEYDAQKGFFRRIFGDAFQIRLLRELINNKERQNPGSNESLTISLPDYTSFANSNDYPIVLSEAYLAGNTASARLFRKWRLEEVMGSYVSSHLVNLSTTKLLQSDRLSMPEIKLDLGDLPTDMSFLSNSNIVRTGVACMVQSHVTVFNNHTIFSQATPIFNTYTSPVDVDQQSMLRLK